MDRYFFFFFSSRRRHTRWNCDWSSDVCSSDLGAMSAANWLALHAVRHMHEYGTRREHLGEIALTARAHAALNPAAVYREPLTMDDYLGARMVTWPFGLYDCDVPVDGSTAVV